MPLDANIIHQQMKNLVEQREKSLNSFQQCVGAISVLQEQLKFISETEEKSKEPEALDCLSNTKGESNG